MDYFYTVVIFICILSMFTLAIDVGKNTILSITEIKWFKATFIVVAIGSICEWAGAYFDDCHNYPHILHYAVTFTEFSVTPYLTILLARSCGIKKSLITMSIIFMIHSALEIILLPFGKIFYIDSVGHFQRGDFYWLYMVACALSFAYIITVFGIIGKRHKNQNIAVNFLISLIFVIGQVATLWDGTIKTGYIAISITAILLYIYEQNLIRLQMINTIDMEQSISNHDVLTGMFSRISFERKVQELNNKIKKDTENCKFGLCECDLNNLKIVNDSFGHDVGDNYIKNCCASICNIFNGYPIYRIGGDEFVILLENQDLAHIEELKKIIDNFSIGEAIKEVDLFDKQFFASGFAVFDKNSDSSVSDVLKRADIEMYKNKRELKRRMVFVSSSLS